MNDELDEEEMSKTKKVGNVQSKKVKSKKLKKRIIIVVACFLVACLLGFLISFLMVPKISLKGNKHVLVNINGKYFDEGVKATYHGQNITKDVKTSGKVDITSEGTYKIVYYVKKGVFESKVTRIVEVKDLEKPKITLTGGEEVQVCANHEFKELGYQAEDNIDGDLTSSVSTKTSDDEVTYTVTDKAGNEAQAVRKLVFKDDTEAPKITLKGGETVSITVGSKYKESGYTVTDNCDIDLEKNVKVTGTVNNNQVGTYQLVYEVTDHSGNKATAKRNVRVVKKEVGGTIYLTFDDGPNQGTTNVILDVLKEEGVKATFFVTNKGPDSLIKREYDEGHTVALHTASHSYKTCYSSVDGYFADLKKVHDRVQRITGLDVRIIRFPGGSSNTISMDYNKGIMSTLVKEVANRGYHYFDWNVSSGDAGETTSASGVYKNVIKGLSRKRSNVVLMHDIKTYTRDAIRDIIHYGKENGYTFAAITMDTPEVHHGVNN